MEIKDFTDLFSKCDYDFLREHEDEIRKAYREIKYNKYQEHTDNKAKELKDTIEKAYNEDADFKALIENVLLATNVEKAMSKAGDDYINSAKLDWDSIYKRLSNFYAFVTVKVPEKYEFIINNWDGFTNEDGSEIKCDTWTFSEWFCNKFDFYKENKYYHLQVIADESGVDSDGIPFYNCRIVLSIWD